MVGASSGLCGNRLPQATAAASEKIRPLVQIRQPSPRAALPSILADSSRLRVKAPRSRRPSRAVFAQTISPGQPYPRNQRKPLARLPGYRTAALRLLPHCSKLLACNQRRHDCTNPAGRVLVAELRPKSSHSAAAPPLPIRAAPSTVAKNNLRSKFPWRTNRLTFAAARWCAQIHQRRHRRGIIHVERNRMPELTPPLASSSCPLAENILQYIVTRWESFGLPACTHNARPQSPSLNPGPW